jgi:CRP/FNR family transcriptional regulator, cyclic AMP receptor protein
MEPIDPQDWQALVDAGQQQDAEPGQVLVREGATGGSLFVVLSGTVVVTRGGRRIGELGQGALLGEAAMLDGRPRTASVIVDQPARLLVVPGSAIRALIAERSGLREALLQAARARLLA